MQRYLNDEAVDACPPSAWYRFRNMAKDMAGRYLRRMPLLNERGLTELSNLLGDATVVVTPGRLRELAQRVDATQKRLHVSAAQRQTFEEQIRRFWGEGAPVPEDVALRMLLVMMNRLTSRRGRCKRRLRSAAPAGREVWRRLSVCPFGAAPASRPNLLLQASDASAGSRRRPFAPDPCRRWASRSR